jgi:hypothetical protein
MLGKAIELFVILNPVDASGAYLEFCSLVILGFGVTNYEDSVLLALLLCCFVVLILYRTYHVLTVDSTSVRGAKQWHIYVRIEVLNDDSEG